jgi:hypothetical protein
MFTVKVGTFPPPIVSIVNSFSQNFPSPIHGKKAQALAKKLKVTGKAS